MKNNIYFKLLIRIAKINYLLQIRRLSQIIISNYKIELQYI